METQNIWRHCGSCKEPIGFDTSYQVCTIGSCNKHAYCSMNCFSTHVPIMRHKDAWAETRRSPKFGEVKAVEAAVPVSRKVVAPTSFLPDAQGPLRASPQDILIVASKLKHYIKEVSDMNTSADVMERLSMLVRIQCESAIKHARQDGRKTVMARDFV